MTTRAPLSLRTDGLDESVRGLRGSERAVDKTLDKGLRRFIAELLTRAQSEGKSAGGVHAHAIREGAFRATSKGIEIDSRRSPTALGAEFGSHRFGQFPSWKGNELGPGDRIQSLAIGYMIHPALRDFIKPGEKRLVDDVQTTIEKEIGAQ